MLTYERLGAFTPVTMEGNVVVDGVLASCYVFDDHDLAHLLMTPIRWFPNILPLLLGNNNGMHGFISIAEDVGTWMLPREHL